MSENATTAAPELIQFLPTASNPLTLLNTSASADSCCGVDGCC